MRDERERVAAEYRRRDADARLRARYDPDDPAVRHARARRRADVRNALASAGLLPLGGLAILEVGCGSGAILEDLVSLGASIELLRGVDLSAERIALAAPSIRSRLIRADAAALPFREASFDIVAQFTTLSSVRRSDARAAIAREMARVLRPDGAILWYDMRRSAPGGRTVALDTSDIAALFPGHTVRARAVTLAPQLERLFAPRLPAIADALERIAPLRTHLLAVARRA